MGTLEEFGLAIQAIESSDGDTLDVAIARSIVEELRQGGIFLSTAAALEDELERALSQEV